MVDFTNVLTTGTKPQHKATAGFATGAIVLAIFVILIVAQLMFAILHPATLAAAEQQAPFGVIGP
jgi:hypothetical protein